MSEIKGTTVIAVVKDGSASIGADGQVTFGNTVIKSKAVKLRKMAEGKVIVGFAGSVADAFTLFDRFEKHIKEHPDQLNRAAVALAREWRKDKILRKLEAMLVAVDKTSALMISGQGDVISPEDGVIAIGSGAPYATAAARALMRHTQMTPEEIVQKSLKITSEICIYTNSEITVEVIG
ncbi:ATP-dependent protease subunit HslV [candidate division WOR-3 bacterium]|nr:ATP-dependent protease subunit HslV [candidate division WOR-3 bacterium]